MSEISAIAAWLRQRQGETDAAWIERLRSLFQDHGDAVQTDPEKTDRIGERLWKRYLIQQARAAGHNK